MKNHFPPLTPRTPEEEKVSEEIMKRLTYLSGTLRQANLNNAVKLAMEAARGEGPLVDHFAELGRRFGSPASRQIKKARKAFTVIKGGKK